MSNRNQAPRTNSGRPLPQEIYIRRRVAALIGVLLVVILLIWMLTSLGGNNDTETTPAAQTAEQTTAAERGSEEAPTDEASVESESEEVPPSEEEEDAAAPSPYDEEVRASEEQTAEDEPKDSCELADLVFKVHSDRASYRAGQQPTFFMSVDNPTAADCEINLDEDILRFEVYNMASNELIWSDTDCYPSVESGEVTVPAGESRSYEATWSRLQSKPDQCNDRSPAPTGGYYVHAVIGKKPAPAYTFNLVA